MTTPTLAGGKQSEGWFLDTGATNHMTGSIDAFAELDRSITGKVRFADGSVVEIHGRGTVVFADKGGDHKACTVRTPRRMPMSNQPSSSCPTLTTLLVSAGMK